MLTGPTASVLELATWLQTASLAIPMAQLSFVSWLMFVAGGALRQGPFNATERPPAPLSKTSFQ